MLPRVSVHRFCCAAFTDVRNYRRLVGDELIDEISELARALNGIRVCHVNSTGFGGGVAELLSRHVPLANALGIHTEWRLAVLPFASHVPYQVRILPRAHQSSFARVDRARMRSLAETLRRVLVRLDRTLGDPHFNLTIGTAPIGEEDEPYFHWHIEILPRLTTPAGFELGSGMAINPVLPEEAAAALRRAAASDEAP